MMSQAVVEVLLMWAAVGLYALSTIMFVVGVVFSQARVLTPASVVAAAGLAFQAVAIVVRWERVGHGPYLGFYEVVASYTFLAVATFCLLVWRRRGFAPIGIVVMPTSFLALGLAMFTPKAALPISATLASYWLAIHVTFAKLSYSSFIVACGFGVLYLLKEKAGSGSERMGGFLGKMPRGEVLDDYAFRFVGVGFVFLGIMIVAGAIWANEAWGRYWGWDPIETWSLVSWFIYAAVLHLRLTMGWRGRKFAWAVVIALPSIVFALLGVPLVYRSIHGAYLLGY